MLRRQGVCEDTSEHTVIEIVYWCWGCEGEHIGPCRRGSTEALYESVGRHLRTFIHMSQHDPARDFFMSALT